MSPLNIVGSMLEVLKRYTRNADRYIIKAAKPPDIRKNTAMRVILLIVVAYCYLRKPGGHASFTVRSVPKIGLSEKSSAYPPVINI